MNTKTARRVLRGCAWSGADDHEREIAAAIKRLGKDEAFMAEFARQKEFDELLGDRLDGPIPEEIAPRLDELAGKLTAGGSRRHSLGDPAMMAAGFAFLVLVGLVVWIVLGSGGVFSGMAEAGKLARIGDNAGIEQFEPVETSAGNLGDWFMMQGFDGFRVPSGFEDAQVVGVRIFDYENEPVAVAAIANPRSFIYVFQAEPLGLSLKPDEWRIESYNGGKHVLAVTQMGTVAFMTTMQGGEKEMADYVRRASALE